jgi:hypothetical protein
MKRGKLPFNPYKGEISTIFYINKKNDWELRKGKFKGSTIPELIKQNGLDGVLEFLYSLLEMEECQGIERWQVKEIILEIKKIESLKFL